MHYWQHWKHSIKTQKGTKNNENVDKQGKYFPVNFRINKTETRGKAAQVSGHYQDN